MKKANFDAIRKEYTARQRKEKVSAIRNGLLILVCILCGIFCGYIEANAAGVKTTDKATNKVTSQKQTDKAVIKEFCARNYPGYKVRIRAAEKTTDKVLETRKGKRIVFVDILETKAIDRNHGKVTKKGPFYKNVVRYAHKARKGSKCKVYLIYSPYSNAIDDVAAIVSGGNIY